MKLANISTVLLMLSPAALAQDPEKEGSGCCVIWEAERFEWGPDGNLGDTSMAADGLACAQIARKSGVEKSDEYDFFANVSCRDAPRCEDAACTNLR